MSANSGRRRFAAGILAVSLGLVLAGCGSRVPPPEQATDTASDSSGDVAEPEPDTESSAGGAPAGPAAGSDDEQSGAPSAVEDAEPANGTANGTAEESPQPSPSDGTATPANGATTSSSDDSDDASAPEPVAPGLYEYQTSGYTQVGDQPKRELPERTTLDVAPAQADQVQTQVRDRRRDDGTGGRTTTTFRFGQDGVVLREIITENTVEVFGSTFEDSRTFVADPPTVVLPSGMPPGFSTTFRLESDGTTIDGELTITGEDSVGVGGQQVAVRTVDLRYTFSGDVEGSSEATWRVRPSDGLVVTEDSRTEVTSQGVRYREEQRSKLLSTTPS